MSSCPDMFTCVNIVGDRYDFDASKSLKAEERTRRQKDQSSSRSYAVKDNLTIPPWKQFISNPKNKEAIQAYLADSWSKNHESVPQRDRLVIGGMLKESMIVQSDGAETCAELKCVQHEEADTRIFAHLSYCVRQYGYEYAVIQATDTDILVMAVYYSARIPRLKELWVKKGTVFIPCHMIAQHLAEIYDIPVLVTTSTLLCCYIISGCDNVSYPFRKGKRKAFKVAMNYAMDLAGMTEFGDDSFLVDDNVTQACRTFFLKLYGDFDGNLDEARAHIFGTTKGDLRCLPPTEDAFHYHMLRGLLHIAVCKTAHECNPVLPEPTLFGRRIRDGKLVSVMMDKPPKPPSATQKHSCKCKKSKCGKKCSCAVADVKCVAACTCNGNPEKCIRSQNYDSDNADDG